MKTTRETFNRLSKAVDELNHFRPIKPTEQFNVLDDVDEINAAIDEALEPFYLKREAAVYEAAKKFVAEYEEGES